MKKKLTCITTALAAAALVPVLSVSVAHATPTESAATSGSADADAAKTRGATEVVAGGVWSYGVGDGKVFSAYDNSKFTHSTSVKSSGKTASSGKVVKGKVAWASRASALFGNQSFWNIY